MMSPLGNLTPSQLGMVVFGSLGVLASIAVLLLPDRHNKARLRLAALKPVVPTKESETVVIGGEQFGALGRWLAASPMIGVKEQEKMSVLLAGAGMYGRDKLAAFIATKATLAIGLAVLSSLSLYELGWFRSLFAMRAALVVLSALIGWRGPDMVVGRIAKKRRQRLSDGVSDALDLLIICAEAGLALEQSLERVARDIAIANPVVAYELSTTVAEMRVLPQMRDALDNFAKRSGLPIIKSVVTTLVQAIQYGTPLSQSLRILSAEMRQHRILQIEARAARLPVLLTIPLILFILPCLFLAVAGPAALQVMRLFGGK
jgi:tight adherence protein C